MKNTNTLLVLMFSVFMMACGGESGGEKKEKLENLKAERAKLETEIAALEKEIGASDTTGGEKAVHVGVTPILPVIFKTYVEIQGRVEAEENVSLSTEMPGTITKINVKPGERVVKGQVLAETDSRAAQQQVAAMQSNLALATQAYEKQKSLWDQKIGTEMQYLQAKTNKESLEATLAGVQEQLRMTKIISPIDGTVDYVNIKVGQAVAPGLPAIRVINFSDLKVEADVAESYTARVKTGNPAQVFFPDMNDSINGKVDYASRAIDPMSRTFKVEVKLDNKKEYHPNMVAKLKINDYVSPKPVVVLPVKFIQKGLKESYVFLEKNGKVEKRLIEIGKEYSGLAEITKGLSAGENLITDGYDLVDEGDKVDASPVVTNN